MQSEETTELAQFFHSLANDIEGNLISNQQMNHIRDFRRDYSVGVIVSSCDSEDLVKFLVLGWYMYTIASTQERNQQS